MKKVCVHLIISGKVQGVSYRLATQRIAEKLELTGCVKNKENGDVDIIASGGQPALSQFINWTKRGPKYADVDTVVIAYITTPQHFSDFSIR